MSLISFGLPRVCGSTLLCRALGETGIAGRSGEFFNKD
ncbi:MAG: hypothetical protein IPL46_17455 [Saprospiraceae bacterium]|nr:hypothetical protein [Saprospiraceae bacterium]